MNTGRLIILTDLDDTLFASERSLPDGTESWHLFGAATNDQGHTVSWQTVQHQRLTQALFNDADEIVPVTGRTSRVLERVSVFNHSGLAIASHGGVVMAGGSLLPEWRDSIEGELEEEVCKLQSAMEGFAGIESDLSGKNTVRFKLHEDLGIPVYASFKTGRDIDAETSESLRGLARNLGLYAHVGIRNAALLPSYTRKKKACQFLLDNVLERTITDTVVTLGDSLSDLPFMALGDFAVQPTQSQIWQTIGIMD